MQNNVKLRYILIWGTYYHKFGQSIRIFKISCTKYMASSDSEAMTSSTHLYAYSYWCFQKCFVKVCETSKCHYFLISQPIFIKFSLFCSKYFTLSSEIKLNLFRISPLKTSQTHHLPSNTLTQSHAQSVPPSSSKKEVKLSEIVRPSGDVMIQTQSTLLA